ncbi:unnamed protein product [Caenorhabditis bovis]|uniref:Uncharacterized protein n=1 Tax=Caenorhabditis bovis TaxID=2654633 RepID=A0A8S1ELC8_9PELO|nr:unnamed protein product [Caenorhabditis bovis]
MFKPFNVYYTSTRNRWEWAEGEDSVTLNTVRQTCDTNMQSQPPSAESASPATGPNLNQIHQELHIFPPELYIPTPQCFWPQTSSSSSSTMPHNVPLAHLMGQPHVVQRIVTINTMMIPKPWAHLWDPFGAQTAQVGTTMDGDKTEVEIEVSGNSAETELKLVGNADEPKHEVEASNTAADSNQ